MKFLSSFKKELIIASRGYYFYVEIVTAIILLFVLLFVVPNNFSDQRVEYLSFDLPDIVEEKFIEEILLSDEDNEKEIKEFGEIKASVYENEESKVYIFDNKEDLEEITRKNKPAFSAHLTLNEEGELAYEYFIQGYEGEKLKSLYLLLGNSEIANLEEEIENQEVEVLNEDVMILSDRENLLPSFLLFNGSLMTLFIIASYIFLDKQEGLIKAFAVTTSSVKTYLASKIAVVLLTTLVSSLILVIPIMGFNANYLLLTILILTSGLFSALLGLYIASFYKNIMQSFGIMYIVIVILLFPSIAYFLPSWNPTWIAYLPTYPLIQSFKEVLLTNPDYIYVLSTSLGFALVSVILFIINDIRYRKVLAV